RPIHQRKATIDDVARDGSGQFFLRQIHDGLDASIEDAAKVPAVTGMSQPELVRGDLSHCAISSSNTWPATPCGEIGSLEWSSSFGCIFLNNRQTVAALASS